MQEGLKVIIKLAELKRNNVPGHYEIDGQLYYFKSLSEKRYASYLQWLKSVGQITEWLYEPETFWFLEIKRGVRSYKPDFKVVERSGKHHWVEVKGYMDARSKTKLARFSKYYPDEKMTVVDAKWFSRNVGKLKGLVPGWV